MKIQIHNYSTLKGGQRIGQYRFKEIIRNLSDTDFMSDNTEQAVYTGENIGIILITDEVGLYHWYSPGVGSLPNEREKIEAFGNKKNIQTL